jgi:hypothetical protein
MSDKSNFQGFTQHKKDKAMITKEQILAATGEELSRLAGEVLNTNTLHTFNLIKDSNRVCRRCGIKYSDELSREVCSVTNPIHLTWPEAMKWRDWAVKEFGGDEYRNALVDIYCSEADIATEATGTLKECAGYLDRFIQWLATNALPEHYIKAACLCKIEK